MNANQARKLIKVQYWPHTAQWRILVAGSAVGYWSTKDEADLRARAARAGLVEKTSNRTLNVARGVAQKDDTAS